MPTAAAAQDTKVVEKLERADWTIPQALEFRREVYLSRKHRDALETWLKEHARAGGAERALRVALAQWITGRLADAAETARGAKGDLAAYISGRSLIDLGKADAALEALRKADAKDAGSADLSLLHAEALIDSGNVKEGAAALKLLQAKHDQRGEFHYLTGRLHERQREFPSMLEAYERAVQFDGDHVRALFRLALYNDLYGEDAKALDLYERIRDRNPTHVNALLNLGVIYEDRGEWEQAVECYKLVLRADPAHERAILFLKDAIASTTMYYDEELRKEQERRRQLLATPIIEFELSVRARRCLEKMQVKMLGELVQKSEKDLLTYRNFGETSLREIRDLLTAKGLTLGQKLEPKPKTWREIIFEPERDEKRELLEKPVSELGLSVRSARCLAKLRVHTLADLVDKSMNDLLEIRNFGKTSLLEIQRKLSAKGLELKADAVE